MGVQGLWSLVEPVGKPVPLESLENKVLAVDVSIWLHQAMKGFRDANGSPLPYAHLLGLFHRVSKLLFYRIKPVFVFDGGVPPLKKQTLAARRALKEKASSSVQKTAEKLLQNIVRQEAIQRSLNASAPTLLAQRSNKSQKDLFELPPLPTPTTSQTVIEENLSDDESEDEAGSLLSDSYVNRDLHAVDFSSPEFRALPAEVQHEILVELKETRKQNSWAKMNDMPQEAGEFSGFQMQRLLKRRNLQQRLDEVTKSMSSRNATEFSLNGESFETETRKLASSDSVHFILAKRSPTKEITKPSSKTEVPSTSLTNVSGLSESKLTKVKAEEESPMIEAHLHMGNDMFESDDVSQHEILQIIRSEQKFPMNDESESSEFEEVEDIECLTAVQLAQRTVSIVLDPSKAQNEPDEDFFADIFVPKIIRKDVSVSKETKPISDQVRVDFVPKAQQDIAVIETNGATLEKSELIMHTPLTDMVLTGSKETEKTFHEGAQVAAPEFPVILEHEEHSFGSLKMTDLLRDQIDVNKSADEIQIAAHTIVDPVRNVEEITTEVTEIFEETSPSHGAYVEERDSYEDSSDEDEEETQVTPPRQLTEEEIEALKKSLERERSDLLSQAGKNERLATSLTDQMHVEAQELLRIFGVPYIIAPMEAEAQCAFLDYTNLTQGTITDDSDIFLFGGQRVYKNMFSQGKYVERFELQDIKQVFKLTREQLISLALLTGSDYTQGIESVGPVTALEILAEFPGEGLECLKNFRDWLLEVQASKVTPPGNRCRAKLKGLRLHPGFPSGTVVQAYLKPDVDESKEKFTWATPDEKALREFAREKFGWTTTKIDDILLPLMKRINVKETQSRLGSFFSIQFPTPVVQMSKRVANAVNQAAGSNELDEEHEKDKKTAVKRRAQKASEDSAAKRKTADIPSTPKARLAKKLKTQLKSHPCPAKESRTTRRRAAVDSEASTSVSPVKTESSIIPQREKDKMRLEANKQQALQIWAQAKDKVLWKNTTAQKRAKLSGVKRQTVAKAEANLSESSESE